MVDSYHVTQGGSSGRVLISCFYLSLASNCPGALQGRGRWEGQAGLGQAWRGLGAEGLGWGQESPVCTWDSGAAL